jgi:hypothetical protein
MANASRLTDFENLTYLDRVWEHGEPAPIWIYSAKMVNTFIRQNKIRPVPYENLPYVEDPAPVTLGRATAKSRAVTKKPWPRPFPGGLRFPHFHCKGRIYVLNDKLWNKFSRLIMKDFQTKLNQAETISFQNVMELSNVITAI